MLQNSLEMHSPLSIPEPQRMCIFFKNINSNTDHFGHIVFFFVFPTKEIILKRAPSNNLRHNHMFGLIFLKTNISLGSTLFFRVSVYLPIFITQLSLFVTWMLCIFYSFPNDTHSTCRWKGTNMCCRMKMKPRRSKKLNGATLVLLLKSKTTPDSTLFFQCTEWEV